uniref:Miff domain-containing protein n=1 Tax=Ascaris lumbricoides TaxID=6252 RepID=A0A0M3HFJ3_ASCLU
MVNSSSFRDREYLEDVEHQGPLNLAKNPMAFCDLQLSGPGMSTPTTTHISPPAMELSGCIVGFCVTKTMTVTYEEDQRVPSLNALETGTVMGTAYSIPVMLDSDSDSISSQLSNDSVDSHSVVASPTWRHRSGAEDRRRHSASHTTGQPMMTLTGSGAFTVRDTRATVSAMQRLAGWEELFMLQILIISFFLL